MYPFQTSSVRFVCRLRFMVGVWPCTWGRRQHGQLDPADLSEDENSELETEAEPQAWLWHENDEMLIN